MPEQQVQPVSTTAISIPFFKDGHVTRIGAMGYVDHGLSVFEHQCIGEHLLACSVCLEDAEQYLASFSKPQ